jgi:murein DD-endopeptidase
LFLEASKRYEWRRDERTGLWSKGRDQKGIGHHRGTDFQVPEGMPVHAMADGMVVRVRWEYPENLKAGMGLHIIQLVMAVGYDSWSLRYTHLGSAFVKPGERIRRFQTIGTTGKSGDAGHPFLHVDLMDLKGQYREIPLGG